MSQAQLDAQIAAVRQFSRVYTRQIGLLEERLLKTEFSLTEGRVLFELAQRDGLTAREIARELGLDTGYLSRILAKFEARQFVVREPCQDDARQSRLKLTEDGRAAFGPLDAASRAQIESLLTPLSSMARSDLVAAMATIQRLFNGTSDRAYLLRPFRIGDVGWVIHRHGVLYADEFGWDGQFEAEVASIGAGFIQNFDPQRECGWIAERDGRVIGSAFIARQSDQVAKLRMVYVEPSARGLGAGRRLVEECLRFARMTGYETVTLWTFDVLSQARRLYTSLGFTLRSQEPKQVFGKQMTAEHWDMPL